MKFLFDHNLSPHLAKGINEMCKTESNLEVVPLKDQFFSNALDTHIISELKKEGNWALVTQDGRMRKNELEKLALKQTGLLVFMLEGKQWGKAKFWQKSACLVRWWPKILDQARNNDNGVFLVPFSFSETAKFKSVRL